MNKLTNLQALYLKKVCFFLFLQMLLLLVVVSFVHKFIPKQVCFLTCNFWLDIILYLLLIVFLLVLSQNTSNNIYTRYIAFFLFSAVLAYIMGITYNIVSISNHNDKKTANTFFKALVIVISVVIVNLLILPFTIQYMGFIYAISSVLFVSLIGLIIWGLFIGKAFIMWVTISLVVFLGLFLTDLNRLVYECKKPGSVQCDPLNGASLLYVDLVNILQKIFILLNNNKN